MTDSNKITLQELSDEVTKLKDLVKEASIPGVNFIGILENEKAVQNSFSTSNPTEILQLLAMSLVTTAVRVLTKEGLMNLSVDLTRMLITADKEKLEQGITADD